MSLEEHLVENILCYVQSHGWQNMPTRRDKKFKKLYEMLGNNGTLTVSEDTFEMLLEMAVYVVYHSTVCNTDFSNE